MVGELAVAAAGAAPRAQEPAVGVEHLDVDPLLEIHDVDRAVRSDRDPTDRVDTGSREAELALVVPIRPTAAAPSHPSRAPGPRSVPAFTTYSSPSGDTSMPLGNDSSGMTVGS